jgi:hypothetical protein
MTYIQPSGPTAPLTTKAAWGGRRLEIARCEERLVLSAIPLLDLAPTWDDLSEVSAFPASPELDRPPTIEAPAIPGPVGSEPSVEASPWMTLNATTAHQQTGWGEVQHWYGLKGSQQTVAVIDSGIAWDHRALGRGFGPGYRVVGGWDFAENDPLPYDDAPAGFHGTHVSGILAADATERSGVAPGVDLVALRVFNDQGRGQLDWTEQALRWVHEHRLAFASPITTVNLSLGSAWNSGNVPAWGTLEDELLQLQQDGIVVVAAAGNSFQQYQTPGLSYPAASPHVIPVAAVNSDGQLSDFSQRHDRVIAAPGRQIMSTVPDHVLGIDGVIDDWSIASGTSMAAPYVSGAAVLIREAMGLTGHDTIQPQDIYRWMQETADTVWDAATGSSYDRLNLGRAISRLFPADEVADTWGAASEISLATPVTIDSWINTLQDQDFYRFTPQADGKLRVELTSSTLDDPVWSFWSEGQDQPLAAAATQEFTVRAGESYGLSLSDHDNIGRYQWRWVFEPWSSPTSPAPPSPPPGPTTDLGTVAYSEVEVTANQSYRLQAARDGLLTIVVPTTSGALGSLEVRGADGQLYRDTAVEHGQWRLDLPTGADDEWRIQLPAVLGDEPQMWLANVLRTEGNRLQLVGTDGGDRLTMDLQVNPTLVFGKVDYQFQPGQIAQVEIDLGSGADQLQVLGSRGAEKVELRESASTIENQQWTIAIDWTEKIEFEGGGGPDRVYLYGSVGNDTLTARPRDVELIGSSFHFHVSQIERTYVHAEQGGEDFAYLYDSAGDDRLSSRPQFSSLAGDDFFNYVAGFERVYAYANGGGIDSAVLYDSAGQDTYFTSGEVASIVGPGFFSYTRNFENVEAIASSQNQDLASIYGRDRQSLLVGSDFSGYYDGQWSRLARGFAATHIYVDNLLIESRAFGQPSPLGPEVIEAASLPTASGLVSSLPSATAASTAAPSHAMPPRVEAAEFDRWSQPLTTANDAEPSLGWMRLTDTDQARLVEQLDLGWLDPQTERRLLDGIFAELDPSADSPSRRG